MKLISDKNKKRGIYATVVKFTVGEAGKLMIEAEKNTDNRLIKEWK